jgi:hypothetical protein
MSASNVYQIQRPGTANSIGLDFPALAVLAVSLAWASPDHQPIAQVHVTSPTEHPGTVGQFDNPFSHSLPKDAIDFEGGIARFYATLLAAQEPLGRDFEQALYKNLSDIYVRS